MSARVLALQYAENPYVTRTWMRGFIRYALTADWQVEMQAFSGELKNLRSMRAAVGFFNPDGIVSACCNEEIARDIIGTIPHVWLDPPLDVVDKSDSIIWHGRSEAPRLAALELDKLDRRQYGVVGDHPCRGWSKERIRSFCRHMADLGHKPAVVELKSVAVNKIASIRQIESWLSTLTLPCGIFAVNDLLASYVLSAAHRLNLQVPKDVAVLGVDNDEDVCLQTIPSLTSIASDWELAGYMAAEALDKRMQDPLSGPVRKSFGELGVIRRASTSLSRTREDSRVADACHFIREHACEGIGVDDVVRKMGCSRRLAQMRYQEATGRSIFEEIREIRFAQVLQLLAQRDIQLGAIADRCGWKSSMALRTYFEKRLGMTMRDWRKKYQAS